MLPGKTILIHITCGQVQLTDGKTESQVSSSAIFTGKPEKQLMAGMNSRLLTSQKALALHSVLNGLQKANEPLPRQAGSI